MRRIQREVPELHNEWLVQAQIGAQLTDLIGLGILPQQEHHRVTHILKQHESNKADSDHYQHRLRQAPDYECEHVDPEK